MAHRLLIIIRLIVVVCSFVGCPNASAIGRYIIVVVLLGPAILLPSRRFIGERPRKGGVIVSQLTTAHLLHQTHELACQFDRSAFSLATLRQAGRQAVIIRPWKAPRRRGGAVRARARGGADSPCRSV